MFETALSFIFLILYITEKTGFPPPLSEKEEEQQLVLLSQGDKAARNLLVERNLRLVAHIVKKYYSSSEEQDDLISIGTIGLIKAIDSFKSGKKVKLGTYASKCIKNEILMFFRSKKKTAGEVSINEQIDTDKDGNALTLADILTSEDDGEESILEDICSRERKAALAEAVERVLDPRERQLIKLRYGISSSPLTQKATAEKMGISRSYVSRIEKSAIEKLREALN
jgi:RNA polymerase sporulation-specific sigma factor